MRDLPGLYWDEAAQRYFKLQPGHRARDAGVAQPEKKKPRPAAPAPTLPPPPTPALLALRECGARVGECSWAERVSPVVGGWSPRLGGADGAADGALLSLSLAGGETLLAGGLGTGALSAIEVRWAEEEEEEEEEEEGAAMHPASLPPPPELVRFGSVSRRSQLRCALALTPDVDGASPPASAPPSSALLLACWLGGGGGGSAGGCASLLRCTSAARAGPRLRELAPVVLPRTSLWAACGAEAGGAALLGASDGVYRLDCNTTSLTTVCRWLGSDALAVACPPSGSAGSALAGLRNGRVVRADARAAGGGGVCFALPSALTSLSLLECDPGRALAAAADGTLGEWDLRGGRAARAGPSPPLRRFWGHANSGQMLLRHAACRHLLAASGDDGLLRLWALRPGAAARPAPPGCGLGGGVVPTALAWAAGGARLWLGAQEGLALVHAAGPAGEEPPPQMALWEAA